VVCLALADRDDPFQEAHRHLGGETQRPVLGAGKIGRTTPALLGLLSVVTLFAYQPMTQSMEAVRRAAWYRKIHPSFSDALALVGKEFVGACNFFERSPQDTEIR
jgi:hypothetical protein